jgi:membrane protease YdiL (CAAX protease family)
MHHNWKIKLLVFVLILFVCLIIGNFIMAMGLKYYGISLDNLSEGNLLNNGDVSVLKWLSTINHLMIFSISSLIWIFIYYGKSYFNLKSIDALLIVYFLCWLLFSFPLIAYAAQLNMMIDLPSWASDIDNSTMEFLMQMLNMDGVGDLLINIVIIAIVPAIGEELLFRGIILKELLVSKLNPHFSIFLVSVLFSLFHFQLSSFLPKMVIGIVLGYAYFWTRNLIYPIIIHFFNNALQVTLLYTAADQLKETEPQNVPPIPVFSIILSAILCAIIVDAIIKRTKTIDEGA